MNAMGSPLLSCRRAGTVNRLHVVLPLSLKGSDLGAARIEGGLLLGVVDGLAHARLFEPLLVRADDEIELLEAGAEHLPERVELSPQCLRLSRVRQIGGLGCAGVLRDLGIEPLALVDRGLCRGGDRRRGSSSGRGPIGLTHARVIPGAALGLTVPRLAHAIGPTTAEVGRAVHVAAAAESVEGSHTAPHLLPGTGKVTEVAPGTSGSEKPNDRLTNHEDQPVGTDDLNG